MRPYTAAQLRAFLGESGVLCAHENALTFDKVKSQCFAEFASVADAVATQVIATPKFCGGKDHHRWDIMFELL